MEIRMEHEEKYSGGDIRVENNRFVSWISNFWYHYKWYVVCITFFVVTFLICFAQCATNDQPDVMVLYAGGTGLNSTQQSALIEAYENIMPEDFDGNGKKVVGFQYYLCYTQEDIENRRQEMLTVYNGVDEAQLTQMKKDSQTNYQNYRSYLTFGDCVILTVSSEYFEELKKMEYLVALQDILQPSEIPEESVDEYGVLLRDTAFYRNSESAQVLPGDSVVCFMKQVVLNRDAVRYEQAKQMFRAIVGTP